MQYQELSTVYAQLEATSKRLEKTKIVSELLKKTQEKNLGQVIILLQGRVFPTYDERKIGVAAKLVIKAIALASGISQDKIEKEWSKLGDLGLVVELFIKNKQQATLTTTTISVEKVLQNIQKLSTVEGMGSVNVKIKLIAELLTSATPQEARYIVRTILEDLRVGVGEGVVRDSITWMAFGDSLQLNYDAEKKEIKPENREEYNATTAIVQRAYDLCNDFSKVAMIAKNEGKEGLQKVSLNVGTPLKVMLYQKAQSIADAFKALGKPVAFEYKYDGFRIVIHKEGDKVKLFTRRLDEVTTQFPEVVKTVLECVTAEKVILDSEAVGYDKQTGKYLPFQAISQRIRRKYDIAKLAESMPVEVNVFDILSHDGKSYLDTPFQERRKLMEKITKQKPKHLVLAKQLITDNEKEAEAFYQEALASGEEGVMAKKLDGVYKPGSRVGYGMKIKPVMETLDLVIVGAEWGEGKRAGWLSSFVIACRDPDTGEFLEVGRVATGVKELESSGVNYAQITEILKPYVIEEKGREVRIQPTLVIEVNYEEIQKSPTYASGFALRFPRFIRLREDKGAEDISTLEQVEHLYYGQRK